MKIDYYEERFQPHKVVEAAVAATPLRVIPGIGWRPSYHYGPFNPVMDQPASEFDRPYWRHDVGYSKISGPEKYYKYSTADKQLQSDLRTRFARGGSVYEGLGGKVNYLADLLAMGFFSAKKWLAGELKEEAPDKSVSVTEDGVADDGTPPTARSRSTVKHGRIKSRVFYVRD